DVHLSTGSSFVMQRWATGQGGWVSTNASAGNSQWFTGDFNGDGKTDLAKIWNDGGLMSADVHYSTGTAFVLQRWATRQGGWASPNVAGGNSQWFAGDFNGDGKADLANIWNTGGSFYADVHLSTGSAFVLQRWATGQGGWASTNVAGGNSQWFVGDFNGDGKTDLAKIWNDGGDINADVHYSTGSSFVWPRWAIAQGGWGSTDASAGNSQWFTGDFNGDGKTDLAKIWTNAYGVPANQIAADVHLSTGSSFVMLRWATGQGGWISTNAAAGNSVWFAEDFDG